MKSTWIEKQVNNVEKIFHGQAKAGLSDVDYLVETEKEILLIEYKNADIAEALKI